MNSSSTIDYTNTTRIMLDIVLSRKLTFIFLIILVWPSIIGSFIVLYHILQIRQIRSRLNNHFFICIFFVYFLQSLCDLPFAIIYFYQGQVAFASDTFCRYWFVLTASFNVCSVQLNAYVSIERYLLIFHNQFLHKYKIILHYIPMIALLIVPLLYVIYVVNLLPCQNHFSYDAWACGSPCYLLDPFWGTFSWIYGILGPLILLIILHILIIVRVIYLRKRMIQRNVWNRTKKMGFQLLSLTSVLCIAWMPSSITSVISAIHPTTIITELYANWMLIPFIYLAVLCAPITSFMAIPELKNEIFLYINQWRQKSRGAGIPRVTPVEV